MITVVDPGRYFHVALKDGDQRDDELNEAVRQARTGAESLGWMGVMVTRHSPTIFTVAVNENVPYGSTYERDACI